MDRHELIVLVSGIDSDGKLYPARLARVAAYNPVADSWRRLAPLPAPRFGARIVWDGHEMLVIGGIGAPRAGKPAPLAKVGFACDPASSRWRQLATTPTGRMDFPAVWTGNRLLIWGGSMLTSGLIRSNRKRWSALPAAALTECAPLTAVWTGRAMILWGGATSSPRYRVLTEGAALTPAVRWRMPPTLTA